MTLIKISVVVFVQCWRRRDGVVEHILDLLLLLFVWVFFKISPCVTLAAVENNSSADVCFADVCFAVVCFAVVCSCGHTNVMTGCNSSSGQQGETDSTCR